DVDGDALDWQPAGEGVAWRHVWIAPGASLSLSGPRLDLVALRQGELSVRAGDGAALDVRGLTAIVRRGAATELRNDGARPAALSVLSVCAGSADRSG